MSLGNTIIGREEQVYISAEASFGTFKAPIGSDAIIIKSDGLTFTQERATRNDKDNSRSVKGRVSRKKIGEFNLSMYVLPSGTAGTPPDIHYALKATLGSYINVSGVSDTYSLARDINESYTISRILSDKLGESFTGCVFNELKLKFSGTEEMSLEVSGFAKDSIKTTPTAVNGAVTSSASVTVAAIDHVEVGSIIQIGTDDNSGAGFEVTAVAANGLDITLDTTGTFADGADIIPFFAAPVTTGKPLGCFPGSITVDGTSFCYTEFELTINNNIVMRNDCFGSETSTGYSASDARNVEFSGKLLMEAANLNLPKTSESYTAKHVICTAGNTAGDRFVIDIPAAEYDLVIYDIPEAEQVSFSIKGIGTRHSGAAESEVTAAFT